MLMDGPRRSLGVWKVETMFEEDIQRNSEKNDM